MAITIDVTLWCAECGNTLECKSDYDAIHVARCEKCAEKDRQARRELWETLDIITAWASQYGIEGSNTIISDCTQILDKHKEAQDDQT